MRDMRCPAPRKMARAAATALLTAVAVAVAVLGPGGARARNLPPSLPAVPAVPDAVFPPVPDALRGISAAAANLFGDDDPEMRAGLFQGDMAISNEMYEYWRVGLRWDVYPEKLWENATVPYIISPLYEPEDYVTILQAINTLKFTTCIKFVEWDGKAKDFLLIWPVKKPDGCWSFVGKFGGPQLLSLQPPDERGPNCLGGEGRAIHEIMHALGIFHEQSRADRDEYIDVLYENVVPGMEVNFEKQSLENTTYTFEYDYDSIMHYGKYFFSKEKDKPTIVPKKKDVKLGQRWAISQTDCLKLNDLYGCLDKSSYHQRRYFTICRVFGLPPTP